MTPRERVKKALNHEEPDRVPVDLGGFVCGIHEKAYRNLARYLNLDVECHLYDYWQRLAFVDERILEMFHVDTRYIFTKGPSNWQFKEEPDESWVDEWGVRRKRFGNYYHVVDSNCPLREANIHNLDHYSFPDPTDPARFKGLKEEVQRMYQETDYALVLANSGSIQYSPSELTGWQQYLLKLAMDQNFIIKLTDLFLEWNVKFFDKALDICGDYIEIVWLGDDWGTQQGPVIDPKVFRKIFKPRYKELVDFIKTKTKAKVCLHSCGSVYWAMQDFIDIGIDALNPIQVAAKDMDDTKKLKREFGDKIAFWGGGCDTQRVLPFGTPDEVREEVKRRISDLAPGGGFVFTPVHNIQIVPPENIVAMYKAVEEYGKYPIEI